MVLSSSQKSALTLIGVGLLVSTVGYISPFWEHAIVLSDVLPDVEVEVGLIFGCYKIHALSATDEDCSTLPWNLHTEGEQDDITDDIYFKAVRVLMAFSFLFMVISSTAGIVSCCRRNEVSSILFEAFMGIFGGVTGVAGVATYAAYSEGHYVPSEAASELSQLKIPRVDMAKGWAFYLSCSGCGFVLLISILALFAPKRQVKYLRPTSEGGMENPGYSLKPQLNSAQQYN